MAARSTSTHLVRCPEQVACCGGKCGGEVVEARYGARSVEVAACSFLRAQGWKGAGLVLSHNQALQYLEPAAPAALRHRDGLVAL